MKIRVLISSTDNRELYIAVTERLMRATRENPENWETVIDKPATVDHVGYHSDALSAVVFTRQPEATSLFRLTLRPGEHPVFDELAALIANELRPKVTPELLELSKQVLNEHGHADAMPDDPGSIAQLTVALRSLIKAVES
ncbi:hypothetical protein SEA_ROBINROSE_104 [Microbacterium phage RobinRose]|nr:hypothetical protein SEA_ROBINROSE_104 [Microbacterium phage RobinRose]